MESGGNSGNREQWSSGLGFILAAAGSAIGLGNIWKFPYITGENGGGGFGVLASGQGRCEVVERAGARFRQLVPLLSAMNRGLLIFGAPGPRDGRRLSFGPRISRIETD